MTECLSLSTRVSQYLVESDVPVVVLIARYGTLFSSDLFDNSVGGVELGPQVRAHFPQGVCAATSAECRWANAAHIVEREIWRLSDSGKQIVMVYPVPEAGWHVPDTYAKMLRFGAARVLSYPMAAYDARYGEITAFLDGLEVPGLRRVYPAEFFCDTFEQGACVQAIDGEIFYYDDDHLSVAGADRIAPDVSGAILAALEDNVPRALAAGPEN